MGCDRSSSDQFPVQKSSEVVPILPVSTSHVVADGHRQFTSSDQCTSCHAGDNSPFGPNMLKADTDISPWGEWSWTMMGLAGRDPISYAFSVDTDLPRLIGASVED